MDKAAWANRLINDPLFKELINDLKSVEIGKFLASQDNDVDARELAYVRWKVIESIENQLQSMGSQRTIDEKRWKIL